MENRALIDLSVPGLRRQGISITNSTTGAHILKDPSHPGSARISYRPPLGSLQKILKSHHALQFSVRYDVDRRDEVSGEIQLIDGYFAHFLAPENLPAMAKHVVFVLDTSGSMSGKKLEQVSYSDLSNNPTAIYFLNNPPYTLLLETCTLIIF